MTYNGDNCPICGRWARLMPSCPRCGVDLVRSPVIKCQSNLDVGKVISCVLERGHEGHHQSDDGFPWEDNPVVYLGPIWLCRGAKIVKNEEVFIIKAVKHGRSKESSSADIMNYQTKEISTVTLDVLLQEYLAISKMP